jgi:cobalt-zinc-cadmium efflux system membrane fusion protein
MPLLGLPGLLILAALVACDGPAERAVTEHDHDHADQAAEVAVATDAHEHDHDHTEVALPPESERLAGLSLATAEAGTLLVEIRLPGQVALNEDRLAHVSPRFEGIVRSVGCYVGHHVEPGDELAVIESNASLSEYHVTAPIAGTVLGKHATPGEFVGQDAELFEIADLSTVWVDLEVPAKYAGRIHEGQEITLRSVGFTAETTGRVAYTAPVLTESTRSGLARIVLPNPDGTWRPGTFVTGHAQLASAAPAVLVARDAVQVLAGEKVVFVPEDDGHYCPVPVETGLSNHERTEILAGLKPGATYVAAGAFELKAELTVRSLSGHAGHGH